jgi:putative DNA primase/helicase
MADLLLEDHQHLLQAAAIDVDVAVRGGVYSVCTPDGLPEPHHWIQNVPGLVFPWRAPDGRVALQYRPDTPVQVPGEERPRKYLWPKGEAPVVNVHPDQVCRLGTPSMVVVVEGTKQYLAAVTAAQGLEDVLVIGIAGCWGWRSDGGPSPDLALIPWRGRDVVVMLDADIATNANVWDAGKGLADELQLRGAKRVKFVQLPDGGRSGLDDVLARRGPDTANVFTALIAQAGCLPKRPRTGTGQYFDGRSLLVSSLVADIRESHPLAIDPGGRVLVYDEGGVYRDDDRFRYQVAVRLGEQYQPAHAKTAVEYAALMLRAEGRVIGDGRGTLVNLANGLLDPFTGELHPHTPDHLTTVQFPVSWDPTATCPTFDAWLEDVAPGQGDSLMEIVSAVVDPTRTQPRNPFLDGPSHSGKSTFVRIIEAIVGSQNCSSVTLHQLAANRFAAAELHGKVANLAADLSAAHIDDLAIFKRLTGDDTVTVERKFGQPFQMRFRGINLFTANTIPTAAEVSDAYLNRMWPVVFPNSFAGSEDPSIEGTVIERELPGVLVRLVEAAQRWRARGGDPAGCAEVRERFARRSGRIRLFLYEASEPVEGAFTSTADLFYAFDRWCRTSNRNPLGRNKFLEAVDNVGWRREREFPQNTGRRGYRGMALRPEDDWGSTDDLAFLRTILGGQREAAKAALAVSNADEVASLASSPPINHVNDEDGHEGVSVRVGGGGLSSGQSGHAE